MTNKGLNNKEVINSRKKYGSNELNIQQQKKFLTLLLESLGDPIIKILLIALAIKLFFLFKDFDFYETIGIFIAILLATFISTISEYGSEKAFSKLQDEASKTKTKVKRNNEITEVYVDEIVVGDLIILETGDKIAADGYLLNGDLSVDESLLNGESKESKKTSILNNNNIKDNNKLYRGTTVYAGIGEMIVTNVGLNTIYGKISKELVEQEPISPLKNRLTKLAKIISRIGYIGAILVTIAYLYSTIVIKNNYDFSLIKQTLTNWPLMINHCIYALTLSVTIIVVAVPEGLPMMITLVLTSNMKKMLKDNVLVRKLVGIETAGNINVLLTDKTGTLSKGKLEVIQVLDGNLKQIAKKNITTNKYKLYQEALFYNNDSKYNHKLEVIGGNLTDRSILKYLNQDIKIKKTIISHKHFNSQDKYSSITIQGNEIITYFKGASEVLLKHCTKYLSNNQELYLKDKKEIEMMIERSTKQGIRVLMLAYKKGINSLNNLVFQGLIFLKDELREESKKSIDLIKKAGIQVVMITGDSKETAISIAKEVGIFKDNDLVMTSQDLNSLSDEVLITKLYKLKVVARALPTDKSRLVKLFQNQGLIVGMTGDGVNDAPALKKANVGFAMGSGTEVSKEASDIVILDDNISSITKAILYGRTIFKSIRKFIIYQLSVNMTALILSIVGPFIGITTPITIVQMLWLNMIMDTFAALAFSYEPALLEYMEEKPKKIDEPIMNSYMYNEIILTSLYSSILCILFLKLPLVHQYFRMGNNNKYLMTAYFAIFIFIGIFNSFNARTHRINIFANITKNKVYLIVIAFIILVQIYLIYFGGDLFRTYGLTAKEFLIILMISLSVWPVDVIRKLILKKFNLKRNV